MPYHREELHYTEAALYHEFEPEGENRILPVNTTFLEMEEKDDGEVIEPERLPKIRRTTKSDGKVVYEF